MFNEILDAIERAEAKATWIEKRKGDGYVDGDYFAQLVREELALQRLREKCG